MLVSQSIFFQSLGWAVVNSFWQMALLWIIYQAFLFLFTSSKPSVKSLLASLFLFTGFAWFLFTFLSAIAAGNSNIEFSPSIFSGENFDVDLNKLISQSLPYTAIIYLVLLTGSALSFLRSYRYVQVIRELGTQKIHVKWRIFVKKVALHLGIKKPVRIWVSEFVTTPVTVGFLKPVILVPLAAINHLSPQQLEAVILHELAHIRRLDYLLNLLLNIIRTFLYYNPFVKAFIKIIESEREKSCDETVLQFQYNSFEYASALLALEKRSVISGIMLRASGNNRNSLLERVEIIMGVHKKPALGLSRLPACMVALLCFFMLNGNLLNQNENKLRDSASMPANSVLSNYPILKQTTIPINGFKSMVSDNKSQTAGLSPRSSQKELKAISINPGHDIDGNDLIANTIQQSNELSSLKPVVFETVITPELKKYQEAQIQKAIDDSRKVIESVQWEILENNMADVFTEKEKEDLKSAYQEEVQKFDWQKWENRLKLAYDHVDWGKVNYQLTNAVNQIRLDSLQKVYSSIVVKLNDINKELTLKNLKSIPDTDITLKEIETRKKEAMKAVTELRNIRNKKVVRL